MKTATSPSNFYFRCGGHLASFMALALAALLGGAASSAQAPAPAIEPQLRAVPPAARQPNYVMLDTQPAAEPEETSEAAPNDASHVGLKLHGHWVIDVLNPDHSLAQHHAFDNSITKFGPELLFGILSGNLTPGNPAIYLTANFQNSSDVSPCKPPSAGGNVYSCEIVQSTSTEPGQNDCVANGSGSYCSTTLTVAFNYTTLPANLVLAGNITANQAGFIEYVGTAWSVCNNTTANLTPSTTSPSACEAQTSYPNSLYTFDQLGLSGTAPTAISVSAGQSIQVTITFTIS